MNEPTPAEHSAATIYRITRERFSLGTLSIAVTLPSIVSALLFVSLSLYASDSTDDATRFRTSLFFSGFSIRVYLIFPAGRSRQGALLFRFCSRLPSLHNSIHIYFCACVCYISSGSSCSFCHVPSDKKGPHLRSFFNDFSGYDSLSGQTFPSLSSSVPMLFSVDLFDIFYICLFCFV